ncbi:MAG: SDR family oxidoreductase [Alistipes sp.]|nr:SDR family oxidoreductase [Alistipes sp.]
MVTGSGFGLAGKKCFVTGGANGIGREIVRAFAQEGALVFFCDRDPAAGRRLEGEVGPGSFYEVDVTDAAALEKALRDAAGPGKALDILVNNVGISEFSPLLETDVERFDRVIATNLRPMFVASRVFAQLWNARFGFPSGSVVPDEREVTGGLPGTYNGAAAGTCSTTGVIRPGSRSGKGVGDMARLLTGTDDGFETALADGPGAVSGTEIQCGRIINIASTRWAQSEPGSEGYAASKGGIVSLTHALSASFSGSGVTVNCVSPGWIETGDYGALSAADHAQHPLGRVGRPGDIARVCLMLADPHNGFIDGENIVVDGGMTRKMIYV